MFVMKINEPGGCDLFHIARGGCGAKLPKAVGKLDPQNSCALSVYRIIHAIFLSHPIYRMV